MLSLHFWAYFPVSCGVCGPSPPFSLCCSRVVRAQVRLCSSFTLKRRVPAQSKTTVPGTATYTSALLSLLLGALPATGLSSPPAHYAHPQTPPAQEPPPKILYDQSPKAVAYQVSRLTNDELARVERQPGDPRYRPVYAALLTRKGLARPLRDEAIAALTKLDNASTTQVLLQALSGMRVETDEPTANQLLDILLAQSPETLRSQRDAIGAPATAGIPSSFAPATRPR